MSFFTGHIEQIITDYKGATPLPVFLKAYFRKFPKLGSRDRKALTEAAFIYYRCARFSPDDISVFNVIAKGIILCNSSNAFLKKMMDAIGTLTIPENDDIVAVSSMKDFTDLISQSLSEEKWLRSIWQQPQLFIRIRRNMEKLFGILTKEQISFEQMAMPEDKSSDCFKIANSTAVEKLLPETDYVVQDWASQASMYILLSMVDDAPKTLWDVCSGAGGKSILLKDKLPPFSLLVSDIRGSILHNLQMRFKKYNLGSVDTLLLNSADVNEVHKKISNKKFDLVLCDVPCSGSGTWARSPEQFHFFEEKNLEKFVALQYPIALNAQHHVVSGGYFAYVTCSVFEKENEAVVQRLLQQTDLKLLHQQIIDGIDMQADCMFIAVFKKP